MAGASLQAVVDDAGPVKGGKSKRGGMAGASLQTVVDDAAPVSKEETAPDVPAHEKLDVTEDEEQIVKKLKIVTERNLLGAKAADMAAKTVSPVLGLKETIKGLKDMTDGVNVESAFPEGAMKLPSPANRQEVEILLTPSQEAHAIAHASGRNVAHQQLVDAEDEQFQMQIPQMVDTGTSSASMPPTSPSAAEQRIGNVGLNSIRPPKIEELNDEIEEDIQEDEDEDLTALEYLRRDPIVAREFYKIALILSYYLATEGSINSDEYKRLKDMILNDDIRVLNAVLAYANPDEGCERDAAELETQLKDILANKITGFY
jgi:hypothetical protein